MVGGSEAGAGRAGRVLALVRDPASLPVVCTAVAWGLLGLVQLAQLQSDPFFHEPTGDAGWFVELGRALARGEGLGGGPLFYSPAMPLLHSVLFRIFGDSMLPHAVLALVVGMGLAAGVSLLARRLGGVAAAWLAGGLWLGYRMGFFFQAEPVFALYAAAGTLAVCLMVGQGPPAALPPLRCFAIGCVIGCIAIGRTNLILLAPLVASWIVLESGRRKGDDRERGLRAASPAAVAVLAGALLFSLPGAIYNRSQGSESFFRTAGGFNFWIGNNARASGVFMYPEGFPQGVGHAQFGDASRWTASRMAGRDLSYDEASSYYFQTGLRELSERGVLGAVSLYARKAYLLVCSDEVPVHREHGFADGFATIRRWLPVDNAILVGLGVLGLARLLTRPAGRLVVMMIPTILLSVLPFFANDRLRFPASPLLAVAAGIGLAGLPASFRGSKPMAVLLIALVCAAIAGLHVEPDVPGRHRALALEFERLGALEANRERYAEAVRAFDRCLEIAPENDSCRWMRARVSIPLGDSAGLCATLAPRITASDAPPPIAALYREHCAP